jgi:hypothetical protein
MNFIAIEMLFFTSDAVVQIPTEIFFGNKKATLDIMCFKFIKIYSMVIFQ